MLPLDVIAGGTPGFVHFGGRHLRLFWSWAPRHYNPKPKKKRPQKKTRPIRVGHVKINGKKRRIQPEMKHKILRSALTNPLNFHIGDSIVPLSTSGILAKKNEENPKMSFLPETSWAPVRDFHMKPGCGKDKPEQPSKMWPRQAQDSFPADISIHVAKSHHVAWKNQASLVGEWIRKSFRSETRANFWQLKPGDCKINKGSRSCQNRISCG